MGDGLLFPMGTLVRPGHIVKKVIIKSIIMVSATNQQIVSKLTSLLETRYIYRVQIGPENDNGALFIVILEGNGSSLSLELSPMIGKIFQEETNFLYRVFPYGYAEQQLKDGNLFFVHGCSWPNLIHSGPTEEMDLFHGYRADEKILDNIQFNFGKELAKINGFMEGAAFFLENGSLSQSVFLYHQVMEMLFRTAELFLMGKERKCHSIREHQAYIRAFAPEPGNLFDIQIEEEQLLLKLLDEAYITTRYGNNYHINNAQIGNIRQKAYRLYRMVAQLFENKLEVCRNIDNGQNTIDGSDSQKAPAHEASDAAERFGRLQGMARNHFRLLKPYENRKGLYKIEIATKGYLDTTFMISNLLKVCILAMYAEENLDRSIPQPTHNVQEVLKHILELIPVDEMELLDELRGLM